MQGNIQSYPNQGVFGGPRFTPGLMPFPNFGPQNGSQNTAAQQFGPNWNYPFQPQNPFNGIQQQQQQQQQNTLQNFPGTTSTGQQSESQVVKKETLDTDNGQTSESITDKIALKVSTILAKSLQSNQNMSGVTTDHENDSESSTDTDTDFNSNAIITPSDMGLTNSSLDYHTKNRSKKQGSVP